MPLAGLVLSPCGGDGAFFKKMTFISTRRFRVNANKNKLDVWLIYQCKKCKHTLNIPIYERVSPQKIPKLRSLRILLHYGGVWLRYDLWICSLSSVPWADAGAYFCAHFYRRCWLKSTQKVT